MDDKELYKQYKNAMTSIADSLNLKDALYSDRNGIRKIRDYFVFLKMSWSESLAYIAIIQAIIIFSALIPSSIDNINGFFSFIGFPLVLPKTFGSVLTLFFILFIVVFGVVTFRYFGLTRRSSEVSCLFNPGTFLYYKEFQEIKNKIKELDEKINRM